MMQRNVYINEVFIIYFGLQVFSYSADAQQVESNETTIIALPVVPNSISSWTSSTQMKSSCSGVVADERDLFDNVLKAMYPWQRPVKNARKPINVAVRLVLSGINDILEKEGIARLSGFLSLKWFNEVHIWNTTWPYSCLDSLHLPENHVWIPELALLNSKNKYGMMLSEGVEKVRLFSNGTVSYRPGGTFDLYCSFDLTYMPFDEQICHLEFESWRYVIEYQTLSFGDPAFSTKYWADHEQWWFIGASANKTREQYLSEATYDHVTFTFAIRRKTGYYWMNVIVPSMIISYAMLSVFALPVGEVIKLHIAFTCLLAYGVFQLMIIEDVPRTSDNIPLLSVYIALSTAYICLAILFEGVVFYLLNKAQDEMGHSHHVPKWLCAVVRFMAVPLCVKVPKVLLEDLKAHKAEGSNGQPMGPDSSNNIDRGEIITELMVRPVSASSRTAEKWATMGVDIGSRQTNNGISSTDQSTESQQNAECSVDKEPQFSRFARSQMKRRLKWMFVADVIERFTAVCYFFFTIATPVVMFGVIPVTIQYENNMKYH